MRLPMEIEISPTKRFKVFGVDRRLTENITWCATSYGINRLFWVDGYLLCTEVFERSLRYEVEKGFLPISQVCYASFPRYSRVVEVQKGVEIPVVDVSDMKLYKALLKAILEWDRKPKKGSG
jgi:hypothetical protein